MKEDLKSRIGQAKNLLDVLLILKDKTMQDTHVATLAYLEENIEKFNDKYGIWRCRPFPLETGQEAYSIQSYYFSKDGDDFKPDSIVVILFTDSNFINNLNSINTVPKPTNDTILHSIKYGVIVSSPLEGDGKNSWRNIKVNGTEVLGTNPITGPVNFKAGNNINISGIGNDITISATATQSVNDVKVNDVSVVTAGVANVTVPTDYVNLSTNQEIDGVKTFFERPLSRQIYKKIEYIQASGTTSAFPYIRTLVKRGAEYGETESLSCILDGYFTETQTQGYCGYDGGGQLGQRNGYWSTEGGNSTVSALTRSTILQVINFNSGYDKLYKDGEQIATRGVSTALSYSTQSDYSLFVAYSGRYSYQPCTSLRLYSFKMYAGDYFNSPDTCVLIRDFIPILDIDGSPCLLDLVSNKVFTNQGLGSFVGGDEIGTISVDSQLLTSSDVSPVALTNDYNSLDNKPLLGDAASRSYTSSVTSGNMNLVTSGGVYTAINNLSNSLATVATSGSYNDLTNTPDIPTKTSDLTNDGDGTTQNDPYAKISDITTPTFIATTFNPGTAITFSQEDLADMYENQYDIIRVTTEILPNVFFNLSFRKSVDTEASGLTSVKYDYTTCANNNQLEEICFQILKSNNTYSTTSYHLQLANPPITDVQTSDGTSIVNNTIATLPGLYAHNIEIIGSKGSRTNVFCTLITSFATPFDLNSFIVYINNMQATGTNPGIAATGTVTYNRVGGVEYCRTAARVAPGVAANSTITLVYHNAGDAGVTNLVVGQGTGDLDLTSLTDAVVKIM